MKMTKAIREEILSKATGKAFDEKLKAAEERVKAEVHATMAQAGLVKLDTVPANLQKYVRTYEKVRVFCRGADLYFDPNEKYLTPHGEWYQIGGTGDYCENKFESVAAYKRLEVERDEYRSKVRQVLNSVNTLNQLAEISPALTALCPVTEAGNLPVPKALIDAVNAKLE